MEATREIYWNVGHGVVIPMRLYPLPGMERYLQPPLAREGQLTVSDDVVELEFSPSNAVLPRSLRIELYRKGWFGADAKVRAGRYAG